MRRLIAPLALMVLAACGGDSGVVTPPPPPPPPSSPPASVGVQAGDGQQAEPAAKVAIKPAVIVRDAGGLPVSGALVAFAVDSGGGSLAAASATTGANGVATAGDWTLGTGEGRNVVKATVGSLSPVKIVATAVIAGASFPAVTIGAGGGSITILQPGPLNGFKLDVPGGAYPAGIQATVSYASNASMPRIGSAIPVSPLITISTSSAADATLPLTIHVPASIPAHTFPVITVYDAASGASQVLTTIAWTSTGVTGVTTSLNSATVLGSLRSSGRGAALMGPAVTAVVNVYPDAILLADYDSGYRPGTDDWEFPITASEGASGNDESASIGPPATSLWYYTAHPSGVRLTGRFLGQAGRPLSNRRGIRWAATVTKSFSVAAALSVNRALFARASDAAAFDQNQYLTIRSRFVHDVENGGTAKPQLVALGTDAGIPLFVIAYRVTGTQVYVADPYRPGDQSRVLAFPAGSVMTSYTTGTSGTTSASSPMAVGLNTVVPVATFAPGYAKVLDGTIGDDLFPTYEFHGWAGRLFDTLFIVDSLRWWPECPQCRNSWATTLSPPPSANVAAQQAFDVGATTGSLFASQGAFLFAGNSPAAGADRALDVVLFAAAVPQATANTFSAVWLDWRKIVVRRLLTSVTPAAPTGFTGIPLSLKHQVTVSLLPTHVRYRWDFGDNTAKVTVDDNQNVQHIYTNVGTYPVTAEIIDVRNDQVIGKSTETATITVPQFAWQFTSVAQTGVQLPPGGLTDQDDIDLQTAINGIIGSLQSTPLNSLFYVWNANGCRSIFLEQFPPGQFAPILDLTFGGAIRAFMGSNCPDPDADYSTLSLTMGTLGSGTLIGAAVDIPKTESIVLPGGSINATMNGTTLSGTFTWRVRYDAGNAVYSFTFQARQVLP